MRSRSIASSLVALSLLAAPVAAQAATAARTSAPAVEENEMAGGNTWIWAVLAIAAVVGAILLLDGDDEAVSP